MNNILLNDLAKKSKNIKNEYSENFLLFIQKYIDSLEIISETIYSKLDDEDKERFILWFYKRWAKIDLLNKEELESYSEVIKKVSSEKCEYIQLDNKKYKLQDMNIQGYDFKLATYDWVLAIHDIYYNQYEHKDFKIEEEDIIIDAGAFTGDTAVLFAKKANYLCEIHSFELLDENIKLFKYNTKLNGIEDKVYINKIALSNSSNEIVKIKRVPTEGGTSMFGKDDELEKIKTITLDDYVEQKNFKKLDLIKMDIEGAESFALKGSINTIKKFKPKLAICLYHYWNDVILIAEILKNLNLDYKFYFKWVEFYHGREAVLLAKPK